MEREYAAATEGVAVIVRPERRLLEITGRAPAELLKGVLSGRIPPGPREAEGGVRLGEVAYSTLLTAKGRMITDLRVLRSLGGGLLLDLPAAGWTGALQYFRKHLPPRLGKAEDRSADMGMLTVLGPDAAPLIVDQLIACDGCLEALPDLQEGYEVLTRSGGELGAVPRSGDDVRVVRNGDVRPTAFDLILPRHALEPMLARAVEGGAVPAAWATWDVLRLEKGRPLFGVDMDQETIPVEAGIQTRAIDYEKGCYTGQGVIVRLRDRGQVNRNIRGFLLGSLPPPAPGTELFSSQGGKAMGWITSSCDSPGFGETIALGYVRRKADGEETLRLGGPEGAPVQVRELSEAAWGRAGQRPSPNP